MKTKPDILTEYAWQIDQVRRELTEAERVACDLGGEKAEAHVVELRGVLGLLYESYVSENERRRGHSCSMHGHDVCMVACAECQAAWARRGGRVAA